MKARATLGAAGAMALFAAPARAECFNCYDGLIWVAILGLAAIIGSIIGLWWLLRTGRGWLLKWAFVAALLYVIGLPAANLGWQYAHRLQMQRHEVVGTLPDMGAQTPILLYGNTFSGRYSFGCVSSVNLFRKTQGAQGYYAVQIPLLAMMALTAPLPFDRMPLELHTVAPDPAAPPVGDDTDGVTSAEFAELADVSGYDNDRFGIRALTEAERKTAAAEIDYVILAPCSERHAIDPVLRLNPAFDGLRSDVEVTLALAPVEKGRGVLSLPDLRFDLLDLEWENWAYGFPPHIAPSILSPNGTVGLDALARSFCAGPDGGRNAAC